MHAEPSEPLTIATWNIHMGIGGDRVRDLQRVARVIREISPAVIGLQEVDNHFAETSTDLDNLAEATGLTAIPGPTMLRERGDFGNALLTRLPVLQVARHDLSYPGREPRGIVVADLDHHGDVVRVAVTHLGLRPAERRFQTKELVRILGDTPVILMGDLNEWWWWGRPLKWLHSHFGRQPSPSTFPARWPLLKLDRILSNPPQRLSRLHTHRTPDGRSASDHLALVATYTVQRND